MSSDSQTTKVEIATAMIKDCDHFLANCGMASWVYDAEPRFYCEVNRLRDLIAGYLKVIAEHMK